MLSIGQTGQNVLRKQQDHRGNIGFDDSFIYDEIALKLVNRKLPPEILLHNEEIKVFEAWTQKEGKTGY